MKNSSKRKNQFKVGEYAKIWVWSETTDERIYVEIIEKDEKYCRVRYIGNLPELIPFRDICHLAYDEMDEAIEIDRKNKSY